MKMENLQEHKRIDFIEGILNNLSDLNRNIALDKSLNYLPTEKVEQLFEQFEMLDSNIFDHKQFSSNSLNRLDRLSFIMSKIADLDFSIEAGVGDLNNHLDHIAFSLNLMRERLEEKFKHFKLLQATFDSFQDVYLLTDKDGNIEFANDKLFYLGIRQGHVIGKNIKQLIFSKLIVFRYGLDLKFTDETHNLVTDFIDNEDADSILRITRKNVSKDQFAYKIELMNRATYVYPKNTMDDPNVIRTINDLVYHSDNQKKNSQKILNRLKVALGHLPNDPLNEQILAQIESKLA